MSWPLHRARFRPAPPLAGGRPAADDAYARDYRQLDALSRIRALSLPESLRLEECVRRLDRREQWRGYKRQIHEQVFATYPQPEFARSVEAGA